jgi:hypothetical protein
MNWKNHSRFCPLAYEILFTGLFTFRQGYSHSIPSKKPRDANGLARARPGRSPSPKRRKKAGGG